MWQGDWDYECQNLCLRRLGALSGKYRWPTSQSSEEQNQMVFGKSLSQRSESNWWRANGICVDNIPRIHYIGHPRRDSKVYRWIKVWTWAIQRKDHLHVNVQRHCNGERGNPEKCETNSATAANYARRFPRGRWSFVGPGSEKKWYGTCSDQPDGKCDRLLNEWCSILQQAVILSFMPPAPWKEQNEEAQKRERSLLTSTVVKKPLNWFFARLFL